MNRCISVCGLVLGLLAGCGEKDPSNDNGGSGDGGDDTAVELEFEGDEAGECLDGADNDMDSLFDCNDDDCYGSPDCDGDDVDNGDDGEMKHSAVADDTEVGPD